MAWQVKYQMEFSDVKGKLINVNFYFDVSGTVIIGTLTGSESPVSISYSGSDDDIFDPIRDSKITINIFNRTFDASFYNDVSDLEDKECWVEVKNVTDNLTYSGWLVSDESARNFDTTSMELQLTVVSPFSLMKGIELLAADGKMLFADYTLSHIITRCLTPVLPDFVTPSYTVSTDLKEKDYVGSADIFQQVKSYIEAFNDDNGRPPKCYDILEKIIGSFALYAIWENNILKIIDIYNLSTTPKDVKIKTVGVSNSFLIGNSESINKQRAFKEVSTKQEYGAQVGLLPNGRFLDGSGATVDSWGYYNLKDDSTTIHNINSTTVPRLGSGRKASPFRMRFKGEIPNKGTLIPFLTEPLLQGLTNTSSRLKTNDTINLKVRFRYFDWRTKYNRKNPADIDDKIPYLFFNIIAKSPGEERENIYSHWGRKGIEGAPATSNNVWVPIEAFLWILEPAIIAIDSVDDIQSYEVELPWQFPSNYIFQISFLGVRWKEGRPSTTPAFDTTNDLWVDIIDVILTKQTQSENYKSTGEQIYLTQKNNVSKIAEPKDIFFSTQSNVEVSGALMKTTGTASDGFTRSGITESLQTWVARAQMAQRRTTRYKIDCEFVSNEIKPGDLLQFKEGATSILPNKYMIGKFDYDVKHAEVKVTAFELNTEAKPYNKASDTDQDPTLTHDLLEIYKLYD